MQLPGFLSNAGMVVYAVWSLVFCRSEVMKKANTVHLQEGGYSAKFWPVKLGQYGAHVMVGCDSAACAQIHSMPYDTTKGVMLGTLRLFRKKVLVDEIKLLPRNYAMSWHHYVGIGHTEWDITMDSLELSGAPAFLEGQHLDIKQFNKCSC